MAWIGKGIVLAILTAALLPASGAAPAKSGGPPLAEAPPLAGDLSVMTYNIHGLPWVVAGDRSPALAAIGQRLRALHALGRAPRVAVFQEAFTAEATSIAAAAGYRYAALGPADGGQGVALPAGVTARALDKGASWLRGEDLGKWEGSGLMILSDYPIVRIRRMAYSSDACAGYDCLAAKGAVLAELAVPGGNVEVADTHMNSRHASGVSDDRANRAWLIQATELRDFIARSRNPALPLVLSGDFNVGSDPVRQAALASLAADLDSHATDGLRTLRGQGYPLTADAIRALDHAKDWELALAGRRVRLTPRDASVPFGSDHGAPLSDHFGYAIGYGARPAA